jgi:ferredoxin
MPADTVIFAVGQRPHRVEQFELATGRGNTLLTDPETLATSRKGIFAAGDVVSGTVSVIKAIASGKKAAIAIDRYLGGDGDITEELAPLDEPEDFIGREENFANLSRARCQMVPAARRVANFKPVEQALDEVTACNESGRCLRCDLRTGMTVKKFWGSTNSGEAGVDIGEARNAPKQGKNQKPLSVAAAESDCPPLESLSLPPDLQTILSAIGNADSGPLAGPDGELCTVEVVRSSLSFLKRESCGKCVLCREGTAQLLAILTDVTTGKGKGEDLELLQEICEVMLGGVVCEVGGTAARIVLGAMRQYREEIKAHIRKKRCPALVCKKFITYHILGEKCQGCGLCLEECPEEAIDGGKGMIHVIDQDECTKCGTCMRVCPDEYGAVVKAGVVKPRTPDQPIPVGRWRRR